MLNVLYERVKFCRPGNNFVMFIRWSLCLVILYSIITWLLNNYWRLFSRTDQINSKRSNEMHVAASQKPLSRASPVAFSHNPKSCTWSIKRLNYLRNRFVLSVFIRYYLLINMFSVLIHSSIGCCCLFCFVLCVSVWNFNSNEFVIVCFKIR